MNIFINAISIHGGGALVVLKQLLIAMLAESKHVNWHIAAHPEILAVLPKNKRVTGWPFVWVHKSPLHLIFWYEVTLPKLLRKTNADYIFSQTNYLPRKKIPCPSLLLVQHAGHFSKKYKQLYKSNNSFISNFLWKQKCKWVYNSIAKASMITVQTEALADDMSSMLNIPKEKIIVIPHGPGLANKK